MILHHRHNLGLNIRVPAINKTDAANEQGQEENLDIGLTDQCTRNVVEACE